MPTKSNKSLSQFGRNKNKSKIVNKIGKIPIHSYTLHSYCFKSKKKICMQIFLLFHQTETKCQNQKNQKKNGTYYVRDKFNITERICNVQYKANG